MMSLKIEIDTAHDLPRTKPLNAAFEHSNGRCTVVTTPVFRLIKAVCQLRTYYIDTLPKLYSERRAAPIDTRATSQLRSNKRVGFYHENKKLRKSHLKGLSHEIEMG